MVLTSATHTGFPLLGSYPPFAVLFKCPACPQPQRLSPSPLCFPIMLFMFPAASLLSCLDSWPGSEQGQVGKVLCTHERHQCTSPNNFSMVSPSPLSCWQGTSYGAWLSAT